MTAGRGECCGSAEGDVWLSVIVPVYNEGTVLGEFLVELAAALRSLHPRRFEIVLVDDASTDGALSQNPSIPELRLVRLCSRGGSGAARKAGVAVANGELIAWVDGDGTYEPRSLLQLLAQLGDADQIIGTRRTDHGRLKWLRLATKRASFLLASLLWWHWIPDLNSGLRIMRGRCVDQWIHQLPDGFSCASTATLAALNHGQRIAFAPIPYRARSPQHASKFHPVFDTLRLWRTIFWMRLQRPARTRDELQAGSRSGF